MGKIVFINQDVAVQKAASEVIRFYDSIKYQILKFKESLMMGKISSRDQVTIVYKMIEWNDSNKDDILNKLKSQVRKYAAELCQSPDIDLVLDASAVFMGDSDNDMTEQFCNYLVEHNRDGLLSPDKQAVINATEEKINSNWAFCRVGVEFKGVIE